MPRLCIVGGGSTRLRAPFDDKDAVIWSTFSVGQEIPRVDACFEIHDGVYSAEKLNALGCLIYTKEYDIRIRNSRRFPIEKLIDRFGRRFNGTVVMILAFAFLEGYRDIELYGCDFSSEAELSRRNFFYWMMGHLSALGCRITIPDGGLLRDECATYSYEPESRDYITYIRDKLDRQTANDEQSLFTMFERRGYAKGVRETLNQIERRY